MKIDDYIKKPVVITAFQIETEEQKGFIIPFLGNKGRLVRDLMSGKNILYIQTLEGDMRAEVGDYIIKGIKGEYYPCKPDIFEMSYNKAPSNQLERMQIDLVELEEKRTKLDAFLETQTFSTLSPKKQRLMKTQSIQMKVYANTLKERIETEIMGDE